ELHCNESLAILLPDVVDRANIRMIQCGCGLRLALETGQGLRVFRDFIRQEFQRDKSPQGYVFSLVDDAHAAATQKTDDCESLGYDGSGGKTLRLRNLNHWFTQEAARLLMVQQELLDLLAQIVLRAGHGQERCPLSRRLLQDCIKHSLRPLPLVRRDFHGAVSALHISRPSHSSIPA